MGARGDRARLSHPILNLALTHFALDVSNKSKRPTVPSALCHGPSCTLSRARTATEQTLGPSGHLPGQRDPCLSPSPAHDSLCDPAWGQQPGILELVGAVFADWALKARPRVTVNYHRGSGAAVAQATDTPQPQIGFTIF